MSVHDHLLLLVKVFFLSRNSLLSSSKVLASIFSLSKYFSLLFFSARFMTSMSSDR